MILKERPIQYIILLTEALLRRILKKHPKRPQIENDLNNWWNSYLGEQSVNYHLGKKGVRRCPLCQTKSTDAFIQALHVYFLLYSSIATNVDLRIFLSIPSQRKLAYLLKNCIYQLLVEPKAWSITSLPFCKGVLKCHPK